MRQSAPFGELDESPRGPTSRPMATNRAPNDTLLDPERTDASTEPSVPEERAVEAPTDDERARLARAVNDLQAAKARAERDVAFTREETKSKLVSELLPVLDNFDRAIGVAATQGDAPAVVDGMRLIHRQLEKVLEGYGLVRFDAVGVAFDPQRHEAMSMLPVDDPAKNMVVIAQHEPGYLFGERLLRAAKVVVGKFA